MGEMLTYIFSSLRSSEKRLDVVTRAVNKQRSFNKQLTIFAVMTTANLVVMKIEQTGLCSDSTSVHASIAIVSSSGATFKSSAISATDGSLPSSFPSLSCV